MSIRHGLLALLGEKPMYGYQLRAEFERRTGSTWPLNVGQVYTTLSRLERDRLVEPSPESGAGAVAGAESQAYYRLTDTGRAELARWFGTPVSRTNPPRDELAIKLAMAVTTPGVDVRQVGQAQRTATLRALQDYTRLKSRATDAEGRAGDLAWLLVLDSLIFQAEAEIRWLDHCEARLARAASAGPAGLPGTAQGTAPGTSQDARRAGVRR
jgi:DNA-binding PadR family transcriptional regulator